VPLSKIQGDVLRLLASHRDPESYVAGSTPLNLNAPRFSGDIDVFHDREERVAQAAEQDAAFLQEHGYVLQRLRRDPLIYTVLATRAEEATKLEWVVDSDFRFFPTIRDEIFGYVLHPVDLAANKDRNCWVHALLMSGTKWLRIRYGKGSVTSHRSNPKAMMFDPEATAINCLPSNM
jgi:hypothetical protein